MGMDMLFDGFRPPQPAMTIVIPGEPYLWPRARARVNRAKGFARFFLPVEYKSWKALATTYFEAAVRDAGLDLVETQGRHLVYPTGPVRVDVTAVFTCPLSDYRKVPRPRRWHDKKADRDNIDKAVLDAGTGIIWRDDGQACAGLIEKYIGAQGEAPHTIIKIWRLE